jgi:hypothetical protein
MAAQHGTKCPFFRFSAWCAFLSIHISLRKEGEREKNR